MASKQRSVIFPLVLQPSEMSQLREKIPTQHRSKIIRELLVREGYFTDENSPKSA